MEYLRQYLVALQHFTRMPLSGGLGEWAGIRQGEMHARAVYWPGVGWFVGLVACVSFAAIGLLLQDGVFAPLVAAVGSTMATVLLTRAFHEESLARFADALRLPGRDGPGHAGVIALVLVLLAKVALLGVLASHSPVAVLLALPCAHIVTRFWPLVVVRLIPYALEISPKNDPLTNPITNRDLGLAAAWCVPALVGAMVFQGIAFVLLALLFSGAALWLMKFVQERRHRGFTSDGLGATQQLCELAFYFGAAISLAVG